MKFMEKESVKKFDLEAAFKALDEIDIPVAEKGIAANRVNLRERFNTKSSTEVLVEDYYDVNSSEDLGEAQEEREAEVAKAKLARIEKIVDLDAETEDDILPSYVGKVIIQCPQCMTLFYKNPEDIEHSEENPDVVNINEICQHCGNNSGYTLIGKVDSVTPDEEAGFDTSDFEESELDMEFPEGTEEVDAEGTGEGAEEMSDDELSLDLDFPEEGSEEEEKEEEEEDEEKKEESLHHSENNTENESEHESENLTLNEDTTDESLNNSEAQKDAEEGSELKTEHESENLTLNEEGNAAWNALSDKPRGAYGKVTTEKGKDGENLWEGTEKYILYGVDKEGKTVTEKEYTREGGVAEVKAARDELLGSDEKIVDVFVSRIYKNRETGEKLEVELDSYTISKNIDEALTEEIDKDLDKKLKAHNDYIEYLKKMIEQEQEALKNTDNEEVKAAIQRRLDAFEEDLKAALPDALKAEAETSVEVEEAPVEKEEEIAEEATEEEVAEELKLNLQESLNEEKPEEKPEDNKEPLKEETDGSLVGDIVLDAAIDNATAEESSEATDGEEAVEADANETPEADVMLTVEETKDIATDVATAVAEPVEDEEEAEEQAEEIAEIVDEKVDEVVEEKVEAEEEAIENGEAAVVEEEPITECNKKPLEEGNAEEANLDKVMDSEEFQKPISEEEVEKYLGESASSPLDFEDLHEETFNAHISEFLKEVYSNVASFEATDCRFVDESLIIEGTIKFNSGKERKTMFEFLPSYDNGKLFFEGINKDFSNDKAFKLNCSLDSKSLITESLEYKFTVDNNLVEGTK